jgi:hypothetical protein
VLAGALAAFVVAAPGHVSAFPAVPFSATLVGHANPVATADPCVLSNTEGGSGTAVHMGAIAWASSETVNFCTNPNGADVVGEFVFTAANGDHLTGTYVALAHPDFAAGQITFSGTWTASGGTGRFAGASGEGTLSGQGSLAPPFDVSATFVGAIAY